MENISDFAYLQEQRELDEAERAEIKYRATAWAMIRPISKIQQEVFPQRVQVHHATTSYGGSIEKPVRDY